jgi:hypothetical protein
MANFAYIKGPTVGAWATGTTPSQADWAQLDANLFKCPNFAEGGTYAPSSVISIGGAGAYVSTLFTIGPTPGSGIFTCNSNAYFEGAVVVTGASTFNGASEFNTDVTVTADLYITTGGLSVGYGASISSAGYSVSFPGTGNFTSYKSNFFIADVHCNDTLAVSGAATFGGAVTLGDAVGDAILIRGNTTVNGQMDHNAATTYAAAATFGTGAPVTCNGTLTANGDVTLGSATSDTLTVGATSVFGGDITANGSVQLGSNGADTISVVGALLLRTYLIAMTGDGLFDDATYQAICATGLGGSARSYTSTGAPRLGAVKLFTNLDMAYDLTLRNADTSSIMVVTAGRSGMIMGNGSVWYPLVFI